MKQLKPVYGFILLIVALVYGGTVATAATKKVAVYITGEDGNETVKKIVSSTLVTAITESGEYAAVERSKDFLDAMSKENEIQLSGEVRDDQIVKWGQKFGVRYVVVVDLTESFEELFISTRMIDVESGLIVRAYNAFGSSESNQMVAKTAQEVAAGLLKDIKGASESSSISEAVGNKINGHEFVDLGLPSRLKWANMNIGAVAPADYGYYFAWGETAMKSSYTTSNSRTYGQSIGNITGSPEYDAARANWGGTWRMPTEAEFRELVFNCTWTWITMSGNNGYKVTGPNGNFIFLPASGRRYDTSLTEVGEDGYYWSSSSDNSNFNPSSNNSSFSPIIKNISSYSSSNDNYNFSFAISFDRGDRKIDLLNRYPGRSIRPVSD